MARGTPVLKGNVWYAVYRVPADDGKKCKQKWARIGRNDVKKGHPDYATKKMVEAYLDEISISITQGTYVNLPDIRFSEFAKSFIEAHAARVRESTLCKYKTHLDYRIIPFFKHRTLKGIKPLDVEKFLTGLIAEGMSPNNAKKYLATLKMVLRRAVELGYLMKSPAEFIKPPRTTKTEMNYLSPPEIQLLIEDTNEHYRTLIMSAAYTGARQGELLGLQWDDIDFNSGYIYIRPNGIRDLKSAAANRKIPMIPELKKALQAHQLKQMVEQSKNPKNLVFTNTVGNIINPSNLDSRVLKPALTLAGLRSVRFHDLRHSYATALLSSGEPLRYVSKLLGHSDASITLKVYSHVLPETEVDAHERHARIFAPSKALELDRCYRC